MDKWQNAVLQSLLGSEADVIAELKHQYGQSLLEIGTKIKLFQSDIDMLDSAMQVSGLSADEMAVLLSRRRSKVYQKQYQEALQGQVGSILVKLRSDNYATISEYLKKTYEDSYIGTMYSLHGQGIPIITPINQAAITKALLTDSKISNGLYSALGIDIASMKKSISTEISRGIATSMSYADIARNLNSISGSGLANAARIVRTEGHRVQQASTMDAQAAAKAKGADVLKQWDATLDGRTRPHHRELDGQICEVDEEFELGGHKVKAPGYFGIPSEDCNCRCALLTRARWALDAEELQTLKDRAAYYGLDKTQDFAEFEQKYINATTAQAAPQKKYLTEKVLAQNIADLEQQQAAMAAGYSDTAEFLANAPQSDIDAYNALQATKDDYQQKLDGKLTKKEIKKLTAENIALQADIDNTDIKSYNGIWKDDVTTADWESKQGSIAAKQAYYNNKIAHETDPAKIAIYQQYLDDLHEFDVEGKQLYALQQQMQSNNSRISTLKSQGITSSSDAFSQTRKDAALWFDSSNGGFGAADAYFDPATQTVFAGASRGEVDGFVTYTSGSGGHNRPLAGYQKPWSRSGTGWEEQYYVGPGQVWIDYEGKGDDIRGLTTLIGKSTYTHDVWLQSGQDFATLEGTFGLRKGSLAAMSDADLQKLVGERRTIGQFLSTAVNEGGGSIFNSKPCKFNIYAPQGSQMLYASDKGSFGKSENELILQRGGTYEIRRIYWGLDATDGNRRKLFVDLDLRSELGYNLFQQDPLEWKGSRANYHS